MVVDVSEKVIVITGSSKGIGASIARAFAKENAKIVINYNDSEKQAKELYAELLEHNRNCILVKCDVSKVNEVNYLHDETLNAFGKVDVLINNAGICYDRKVHLMTLEEWQKVVDVNLTGTFLCASKFAKTMITQKKWKNHKYFIS